MSFFPSSIGVLANVSHHRIPVVVTDKTGYAIVKVIPGPECDDWVETVGEGADMCEEGRCKEVRVFADAEQRHRRGNFPFVSAGPTHGNGRLVSSLHPSMIRLKTSSFMLRNPET